MNEVLAAGISGALALVGVIFSNAAAYRRTEQSIRTAQIVTDTKLEELTREVREHNGFAKRMPVVEAKLETVEHQIKELKSYHVP